MNGDSKTCILHERIKGIDVCTQNKTEHKGLVSTSGPHKDRDVHPYSLYLELSLVALNIDMMQVEVELPLLPINNPTLNRHLVLFLLAMMRMRWICIKL